MSVARYLLLQQPSGGFAPVSFPASGTLYPASADGVYVLDVDQPSSPDPLTRISLFVRASSLDATNTYLLNDGWELRLESQADGTWDAKAGSVTDGTTDFDYTAADVGTSITALAWDVSGSTLKAWYSTTATPEYPSDFTQIGSDITSALYQGVANVGASYNGATGSQLLPNNDFSVWTQPEYPDGWTLTDETGTSYVEENANGVRFVTDTGQDPRLRYTLSTIGNGDNLIVFVDNFSVTGGTLLFGVFSFDFFLFSSAGTTAEVLTSSQAAPQFRFYATTPAEFITSQISVWLQAALDNDTDGAVQLRSG